MVDYACVPSQSLLPDTPPPNFESLRGVLLRRIGGGHRLAPLQRAIQALDLFMRASSSSSPRFDFFSDLLPHIHSWAIDFPSPLPFELPLLRAGTSSRAPLSRGTIRTLLSNAFFLNVVPFHESAPGDGHAPTSDRDAPTCRFGDISFMRLYTSPRELGQERLLCLLAYFACAQDLQAHELDEEVCFERHVLPQSETPKWSALDLRINVNLVSVHTERMENSDAKGFMDFANKSLHIHKIIASATQEEILFSACPESFVGVLISEVLNDREAIIIRNVRRYVEYEGYASTFRFTGFYPGVRIHDIVAVDATNTMHFTKPMIDRDLNKAYLGFSAVAAPSCSSSSSASASVVTKVSTSHWGCGAFHGDKHCKFLQQVCASALAGVPLDYSTFGDAQIAVSFKRLLGLIDSNNHTLASVYRAMSGYRKEKGAFLDYVTKNLSPSQVRWCCKC